MLRLFCAILLASVVTASAEMSLGVNFEYYQYATDGATSNDLSIEPFVGIRPINLIEIDPSFAWTLSSSKTNGNSKSVNSIEPGCGLYFHLLENGVLGFALGPKVSYKFAFAPHYDPSSFGVEYDKYFNGTLNVSCQVAIDLMFSKYFACRLTSSLLTYSLNSWDTETKSGATSNGSSHEFDFRSIFKPTFGFLFTF